ncbi:MAG: PRC-barrel domain-containing protein [Candidatus Woesearchaeota archaeon]
MVEIKELSLPVRKTINLQDFVGRNIIDKKGNVIGIVESFRLDPKDLTLEAVEVTKGFFAEDHFIGKDYIAEFNRDGIKLNIVPVTEFINKTVFDTRGNKIGSVKELNKAGPTNQINSLIVNRGLSREDVEINVSDIREIGKNVHLNIAIDGT